MRFRQWIGLSILILTSTACLAEPTPEMIFVRGGNFRMGVEGGVDNPAHQVYVNSFYMAKDEVTVEQWRRFTKEAEIPFAWNHFEFVSMVRRNVGFQLPDNWPMYYIIWYEAVWYCNWLSELHGLEPAYELDVESIRKYLYQRQGTTPHVSWRRTANGFRLPTEAEWEYAASHRARCQNGNFVDILEVAWLRENSEGKVHPVGSKLHNELGIYDMLGNVGEWCWDYFDDRYYYDSPSRNPTGPVIGHDPKNYEEKFWSIIRSSRGGSWIDTSYDYTLTFRFRPLAVLRGHIGIRLVRNATDKTY